MGAECTLPVGPFTGGVTDLKKYDDMIACINNNTVDNNTVENNNIYHFYSTLFRISRCM